ncbi:MAG: hypothetical protein HWN66_06320 [Candidatus Helarchaeota archaeon]|nr:hypothetical protein [Candidatus Helarchaeota archaeon]
MFSEDVRSFLAIVSLGLGIFGIFYLGIWVSPPAIICAVLALITGGGKKPIETPYKICALFGLVLGIYEIVFGTLYILDYYYIIDIFPNVP